MNIKFLLVLCSLIISGQCDLPEIYQDVLIHNKVVQNGIRSCADRYEAIQPVLSTLPPGFKSLDIGASQGYFSFKMAEEFKARCVMIEDGYAITNSVWNTADYLKYLCEQNNHLKNITLLKKKVFLKELELLRKLEQFDVVVAFSIIHHMRRNLEEPFESYLPIIDAILHLAPVVIIETPVNTGDHTLFIVKALRKKGGKLLYQSKRGSLVYEIYLFDQRVGAPPHCAHIKEKTYNLLGGYYTNLMFSH